VTPVTVTAVKWTSPVRLVMAAFALGLAVSPLVFHHYDVVDCFLTWARGSGGRRPWDIYLQSFRTPCDYPPVVPYLLTLVEAARRLLDAAPTGAAAVVLMKLPNLLAWVAHVPLVEHGLRVPFGADAARRAAVLTALSPPLFVNAALWGQFDALLSLLVVATVVFVLQEKAAAAGAALGLALATKLLAVVAVPVLAAWSARRLGWGRTLAGAGAAVLVMAALSLPMIAGGAAAPVLAAYEGAVGYYPYRTVEAYNLWYVLDRFDIVVRGMPAAEARTDARVAFGSVTHHHLGLAALAAYTAWLVWWTARRPTAHRLVIALALQFFAFFMLPTQMHQRYVLPAAVLAALVAWRSPKVAAFAIALAVVATLNQGLDLARSVLDHRITVDPASIPSPAAARNAIRLPATMVAVFNVLLLAWATVTLPRETDEARLPSA
jgi:hypothetical protein